MMDDRDLAYHGLAIKRHAPAEAIADLMGLPEMRVNSLLQQAAMTGRAIDAKGAYALTALARVALEGRYSLHFVDQRTDTQFVAAYEGFERINNGLKQVITDWQTITVGGAKVANDHSDKAHDGDVIDRLGDVHDQVENILAILARPLPRMAIYTRKLLTALEKAEDGDHAWVSDIRRESYHTVWFELHEDLLRIMGRVREE
jgi:hypothetical protein